MKGIRNKVIVGGLFGVAVVVGLLLYADIKDIGARLRAFPPIYFLPILGFTLFNYAIRWVKWHYYLRLIGVKNISKPDSASVFVSGFVLALSPGKVAEAWRAEQDNNL